MRKLILAVAVFIAISVLISIVPVRAFKGSVHEEKDNKAFDDLADEGINFSPEARKKVNKGNTGQDGVLSGTWEPKFHGDRKSGESHATAFDRLRQYIKEEIDRADELFAACHTKEGLDALGRALHALQDFYAHSNYVELDATEQQKVKEALDDPLKTGSVQCENVRLVGLAIHMHRRWRMVPCQRP